MTILRKLRQNFKHSFLEQIVEFIFIKRIFTSFSIYAGANFVSQVIPFILLPVLTRLLSPREYGLLATFTAIMGISNIVVPFGTSSAVIRGYYDRGKKDFEFSEFICNSILINILGFVSIVSIVFCLTDFFSQNFSIPFKWILIIPIISFCFAIYSIPLKLFIFQKKPMVYAGLQISNTFLEIGLSLVFIMMLSLSWQGRVLAIATNKFIFALIGVFILFRKKLITFTVSAKHIKNILAYGIPVVFHSLGFSIVAATDKLFLNKLLGLSTTGIYSVGYYVATIIAFFVSAFDLTWTPMFYEKLNHITLLSKIKLVKLTYLYFALIILTGGILIFIAPFVIRVFIGPNFLGAVEFVFWIALGYVVHGMYTMIVGYIFYQKKTYVLSWIAVLIVMLNIGFNYVFIKLNGAIGAAQATFVAFLIRFILVWYLSNRVYPMPWFGFLKNKTRMA